MFIPSRLKAQGKRQIASSHRCSEDKLYIQYIEMKFLFILRIVTRTAFFYNRHECTWFINNGEKGADAEYTNMDKSS